MRRKVRRALRVRSWSRRTKVAIGVWVPAIVVALALFTGPNRPPPGVSEAQTSTTRKAPRLAPKPVHVPDTVPFDAVLGSYLKAAGYRRAAANAIRTGRRHKPPSILTTKPARKRR
jgi:hypothetical protein